MGGQSGQPDINVTHQYLSPAHVFPPSFALRSEAFAYRHEFAAVPWRGLNWIIAGVGANDQLFNSVQTQSVLGGVWIDRGNALFSPRLGSKAVVYRDAIYVIGQ